MEKMNNNEIYKKLSKIVKNNKDCILCQKKINFNSMPNLINKALGNKYNDYKINNYSNNIDDILKETSNYNFYSYLEINCYIMNENIFRKFFPINKIKKKMMNLWKIYQFVLFIPRVFHKSIFKIYSKYFNTLKKERDNFLQELIKNKTEDDILKLRIDIREIFKLKIKNIVVENNYKDIKNKLLNQSLLNLKNKKIKENKLSIKNIINSFKDKNLINKCNDINISPKILNSLKVNFMNSLSDILNNSIFNNKIIDKDYSKLSFLKKSVEITDIKTSDVEKIKKNKKIKRNFKKKKKDWVNIKSKNTKTNDKSKNITTNDKSKNYSIKNFNQYNKNEIKKIKIVNNFNINNGNQYKNVIKNLNFPIKSININHKINNLVKTMTNRAMKNSNTQREFKSKKPISRIKKERKDKNFKTLKSHTNNKNLNKKNLIEKCNTQKELVKKNKINTNGYKVSKTINNKKVLFESSCKNQIIKKNKEIQFHSMKFKNIKNRLNTPLKESIKETIKFNKIKKKNK